MGIDDTGTAVVEFGGVFATKGEEALEVLLFAKLDLEAGRAFASAIFRPQIFQTQLQQLLTSVAEHLAQGGVALSHTELFVEQEHPLVDELEQGFEKSSTLVRESDTSRLVMIIHLYSINALSAEVKNSLVSSFCLRPPAMPR